MSSNFQSMPFENLTFYMYGKYRLVFETALRAAPGQFIHNAYLSKNPIPLV